MVISLFQQSGGGGSSGDKIGIAPPTISSTGLTYDGTAKSPVIGPYNEDAVAISYTPQVNAGTYSCTIALRDKSKYVWLDTYDTDNKTANWTVAKASGSSSLSKYAVELEEGGSDNVTVTRAGDGAIIATSADTSIATVSVSGNIVTISDGGTEGTTSVSISVAAGTNYNAVGAKTVTVEVTHSVQIVTWAGGTDAQIVAMCEASDEGKLNLWDYWNVGDERVVHISQITTTTSDITESGHRAQDVIFVIVQKGGYATTSRLISAFIIQQKNCLSSTDTGASNDSERGNMWFASGTAYWYGCSRRTWCNNEYKSAMPTYIQNIIKQVYVYQYSKNYSYQQTQDQFFLPAAKEINGLNARTMGYTYEYDKLLSWAYYTTVANRSKKIGNDGVEVNWWLRSIANVSDSSGIGCHCYMYGGQTRYATQNNEFGIAPCACIGTVNNGSIVIPSWKNGTATQIVNIVQKADAGEIDLTDYWNIGDKRLIKLSAMNDSYEDISVGETHRSQYVSLVLVDKNNQNYKYATPTSGRTYCSFIVQQENLLASSDESTTLMDSEMGYMNAANSSSGGWASCVRRQWCNYIYYQSIPSNIRDIFKQVNLTYASTDTTLKTSKDYFFLPAIKEIIGGNTATASGSSTGYSSYKEFNALSQWEYYTGVSGGNDNKIKYLGYKNTSVNRPWWTRSKYYNNTTQFVNSNSSPSYSNASTTFGLAPCGCI